MATLTAGMAWFKKNFAAEINGAINGTPFSLDLMTALATQESFEIWGNLFTSMSVQQILPICVGDVIGGPRRTAFPTSKQALLAIPNGAAIFASARQALEDMGAHNAAYHKIAASNPDAFCHGFGIFQYDIQFCKTDPAFFLNKGWANFTTCLQKALTELKAAQGRAGLGGKANLSNLEMAYVAIAYNAGSFDPKRGLKQGFKDSDGSYYGELIKQYIDMAAGVPAS